MFPVYTFTGILLDRRLDGGAPHEQPTERQQYRRAAAEEEGRVPVVEQPVRELIQRVKRRSGHCGCADGKKIDQQHWYAHRNEHLGRGVHAVIASGDEVSKHLHKQADGEKIDEQLARPFRKGWKIGARREAGDGIDKQADRRGHGGGGKREQHIAFEVCTAGRAVCKGDAQVFAKACDAGTKQKDGGREHGEHAEAQIARIHFDDGKRSAALHAADCRGGGYLPERRHDDRSNGRYNRNDQVTDQKGVFVCLPLP